MTKAMHVALATLAASAAMLPASPRAARGQGGAGADTTVLARGQRVVETVCSACHTMHGPPKAAPPFRMVVMQYRRQLGDSAAVVQRIVDWIGAPSASRSLLPPMMRQRWGVMPPLPLPEADRRAAATYLVAVPPAAGGRFMGQVEMPRRR